MMNLKNLLLLLACSAATIDARGLKPEQIKAEKERAKNVGPRKFRIDVLPKGNDKDPHTVAVTSIRVNKETKEVTGVRLVGSYKSGPHFRASRLVKAKNENGAATAKEALTVAYGLIGLVEYEDTDESGGFTVDADEVHRTIRLARGAGDKDYETSFERDVEEGTHTYEAQTCNDADECVQIQMIVATETREFEARNQTRVVVTPTSVESVLSFNNLQFASATSKLSALAFFSSNKLSTDDGEDEIEATSGDDAEVDGVGEIEVEADEEGGGRFRFAETITCVAADGTESEGTALRTRLTKDDLPGKIDKKVKDMRHTPIKDRYEQIAAESEGSVETQRKLFIVDFDCPSGQPSSIIWDPSVEVDDNDSASDASSAAMLSTALLAATAFLRM